MFKTLIALRRASTGAAAPMYGSGRGHSPRTRTQVEAGIQLSQRQIEADGAKGKHGIQAGQNRLHPRPVRSPIGGFAHGLEAAITLLKAL